MDCTPDQVSTEHHGRHKTEIPWVKHRHVAARYTRLCDPSNVASCDHSGQHFGVLLGRAFVKTSRPTRYNYMI
eukprot:2427991-Amphidinium_carterae.1